MTDLEKQVQGLRKLAVSLGGKAVETVNELEKIKDTLPPEQRKKVQKAMDEDENLNHAAEIISDINFNL